jgi:hypothetical protein
VDVDSGDDLSDWIVGLAVDWRSYFKFPV